MHIENFISIDNEQLKGDFTMRICIKNLSRQEVRECYYAHVVENILTLHITGFNNIQLKFEFFDNEEASSVLETLLTTGYYDFEYREFEIMTLN